MKKVPPGCDFVVLKETRTKLFALWKEKRWEESVIWWKRLVDVFAEDPEHFEKFEMLKWAQRPSDKERSEALISGNSGSDLYYIARRMVPHFNATYDAYRILAYEYLEKAATLGHACATYLLGGVVEKEDPNRGLELMIRAAELGSGAAGFAGATRFYERDNFREGGRLDAIGALSGQLSCATRLEVYRYHRPLEITPLGEWEPRFVVHMRVSSFIREAMMTSFLIFGRRGCVTPVPWLPIYVRNLIAFYICTRNGWERYDGYGIRVTYWRWAQLNA